MTQLMQQPAPKTTTPATPRGRSHSLRLALIALLALVVVGGFALARPFSESHALARETEKLAVPTVAVTKPSAEPSDERLMLPAHRQAYTQSAIYARANGYLVRWT